jgi:hypothetical protein
MDRIGKKISRSERQAIGFGLEVRPARLLFNAPPNRFFKELYSRVTSPGFGPPLSSTTQARFALIFQSINRQYAIDGVCHAGAEQKSVSGILTRFLRPGQREVILVIFLKQNRSISISVVSLMI